MTPLSAGRYMWMCGWRTCVRPLSPLGKKKQKKNSPPKLTSLSVWLCVLSLPKYASHYKFHWHFLPAALPLSLSLSPANLPAALSALYSRAPSSREEMPSPEEVYFKDSPVPFVLSLLSISRRDGFIAHPIDWASLSPARPFSQRVKHWFVNGGKHSGPCVECSGPLLFLCTHTHTPTIHHQD